MTELTRGMSYTWESKQAGALSVASHVVEPHPDGTRLTLAVSVSGPLSGLGWLFTKDDFYRSPDGVLDINVLQNNIKSMVDLGFLKAGVDAKKYQDFSLVKEAADRLK